MRIENLLNFSKNVGFENFEFRTRGGGTMGVFRQPYGKYIERLWVNDVVFYDLDGFSVHSSGGLAKSYTIEFEYDDEDKGSPILMAEVKLEDVQRLDVMFVDETPPKDAEECAYCKKPIYITRCHLKPFKNAPDKFTNLPSVIDEELYFCNFLCQSKYSAERSND